MLPFILLLTAFCGWDEVSGKAVPPNPSVLRRFQIRLIRRAVCGWMAPMAGFHLR
jgi:hypothetical protein